jgi:exopolyphosphatase/guanosine-5'-triphosphate,3'-diphosphate pyrophosphatase
VREDAQAAVGSGEDAAAGVGESASMLAYAALDLGSNNCRLLIAEPAGDGFRVVDAFSRIVRLGEGMSGPDTQLILSEPAMRRTVKALRVCANKMHRRTVAAARCVATEACRRATNAREFVKRVRRQTGIALEVISNRQEAELAVAGCAPLFDSNADNALIFDIGGGSTEIIWVRLGDGEGTCIRAAWSMPCGVITLAERFGRDRYPAETYRAMVEHARVLIAPFEAAHAIAAAVRRGRVQMVGTSGTVTTLAGIELGLARYDRNRVDGTDLDPATVRRLSRRLADLDYEARAAHSCIGRDRADLVVGGCALVEAICDAWPVDRLRVADRGVREGILYDLIAGAGAPAAGP